MSNMAKQGRNSCQVGMSLNTDFVRVWLQGIGSHSNSFQEATLLQSFNFNFLKIYFIFNFVYVCTSVPLGSGIRG